MLTTYVAVKKLTNWLKIFQIGRPTAGYKACNMLVTYGWISMVKLNKIGEYSSILINDSPTTTRTRTKQKVDPRCTK
jgi:hypothetical protein